MRHWTWTYTAVVCIEATLLVGLIFLLCSCSSSRKMTVTSTAAHQAHVSQVDSGATQAQRDSSGVHSQSDRRQSSTERTDSEHIVETDVTVIHEHADGTRTSERRISRTRTTDTNSNTRTQASSETQDTTTVTASTEERRGSVHKTDSTSTEHKEETKTEKKSSWKAWISGVALIIGLCIGIFIPIYLTRKR